HDFNNIMTVIQVSADLAMAGVEKSDPIFQSLVEIQESAERASDLTHQLLFFSRKQPIEFKLINVNQTIDGLLNMLKRLIDENIVVTTLLEPALWPIRADQRAIEQVIINIIINAKDAMPQGGEVILKTKNVILSREDCESMSGAQPGEYVCISIIDNGFGMDKLTVSHIFEPFFSTKEPGKGTGLGLSVVYGIVKRHNGWIDVQSEPNQGTEFYIYFPTIHEELFEKTIEKDSLRSLQGNGERILFIEDEDNILEYVNKALTRCGYRVFTAANSREALDVFKKEEGNFHLVFSDVVLPDDSGVNLMNKLLTYKPNLHILLSSGYTDSQSQRSVIEEKGFPFLQKPYTLNSLLHIIRDSIEQ
ncbi:ATP-binding protein, partial [bacterium]|nr:ATP-binding protein [bacterium]